MTGDLKGRASIPALWKVMVPWRKAVLCFHGSGCTEQVAQGGCGCPIPAGIQGQVGCGSGQPGLLVGNPACSRGLELMGTVVLFNPGHSVNMGVTESF